MNDLRNYINLMESIEKDCDESCEDKVEESIDTIEETESLEEGDAELLEFAPDAAVEDMGLEGSLDIRGLAKLLPEVDDSNRFMSAVRKIQHGDLASLTIAETRQLAKAFVSMLKDDTQETMKVMQKLRLVHAKDAPVA